MKYLHEQPGESSHDMTVRPIAPQPLPYVNREPEFVDVDTSSELREYLNILYLSKRKILLFTFLGILGAIIVCLFQTPIYLVRSSLEIQGHKSASLNDRQANAPDPESDVQTQGKLLTSRTLIGRVLNKLDPKAQQQEQPVSNPPAQRAENQSEEETETNISLWQMFIDLLKPPQPIPPKQRALAMAVKTLKAVPVRESRIIEITCESTSPRIAADFVNTLTSEYIEQTLEDRWDVYQRTGEWLSRAHQELKSNLEKSEERLQEYARSSGLMFTGENTNVDEEKLKQVQTSLSAAQADRIGKEAQYNLTISSAPETLPEVLDNGPLREYQVRLAELRRQMAELSSTLTPAHYKVTKLQAQITELESTMVKERSNIIRRIRNEYQAALGREKLLARNYADQAGVVSGLSEKAIQYNILKREVDTNRQLYQATLQKGKEASIDSALQSSNVRIADPAIRPRLPYKPNLPLNLALGLLSGVFAGVLFVLVREYFNRCIRVPGETPLYLNVPELGVIPSSKVEAGTGSLQRLLPTRTSLKSDNETAAMIASGGGGDKLPECVELATWQQKPSMLAESFRTTLASILFSDQTGKRPQVIVVTSTIPGEGKTTIISNLGIALAEISKRVLLVDADMRKPRLHCIFGRPSTWGLIDVLKERTPVENYPIETLARKTDIPNLYLLASGGAGKGSFLDLLHSPRMSQLLNRFRQEFDTILIDTPPMMQISDARVISRLSDAVILAIRVGKTQKDSVVAAIQRIHQDGSHFLGTILNDWDPRAASGAYHYHYNYSYYSTQGKQA